MSTQNRQRILVVAAIPPDLRNELTKHYELVEYDGKPGAAGPHPKAPGFSIAVTMAFAGASAGFMDALPDLRLVAVNGAGLELLDLPAAAKRGIVVANTPDQLTEDTADGAIALMYAIARRTVEGDRFVRAGNWLKGRMMPSRRLFGKTAGIVGLGKIGQAIARRAAGIGMKVMYQGPRRKDGVPYSFVADVAALAEQADVLILSCPGGEATRNIVNKTVLEKLGPESFLVNISRGTVVDEPALIEALEKKIIGGAALDVFSSEPKIDERFYALDNVVLQPHSAAITYETRIDMTAKVSGDIADFIAGKPIPDAAARYR